MAVRVARVAVPAVAAGALIAGIAVTSWPQASSLEAVPAPATTQTAADAARAAQAERADRDLTRPSLTSPTARQAQDEVADEKAAARSASAKDADQNSDEESEQKRDSKADAKKKKAAAEKAAAQAALDVVGTRYTTTALNVRTKASDSDKVVVETLKTGSKVKVTDTVDDGFRLISDGGKARWVKNDYLAKKKPDADAGSGGVTMAACGLGSGMESGLTKDAILVHRTVCARYPQVTSFGGRGGGGFHATGQAVDCMISNSAVGWELARWVRANASRLGVSEVIFSQKIWTVQRSGEGWRPMSDRGSATANHYDHVHVSVYGNRATG
jgi:SH3 domain-containing protein